MYMMLEVSSLSLVPHILSFVSLELLEDLLCPFQLCCVSILH